MAKPKQKWTMEEEEALCAGVEKYGHGKWKVILGDPEFACLLASRSNIDLKDKWRNLSVSGVSSSRRIPRLEGGATSPPVSSPEPLSMVPLLEYGGTAESSRSPGERRSAADYSAMIFDALFCIRGEHGADANQILDYIEREHDVPPNFRRSVNSKLRRLVLQGELEKVNNCYKIKNQIPAAETRVQENKIMYDLESDNDEEEKEEDEAPPAPIATDTDSEATLETEAETETETLEDAARYAAYAVTLAETAQQDMIDVQIEIKQLAELLKASMANLKVAEELQEIAHRDGIVWLNP